MEAAKNRFVKIDGSGDLLLQGKRHVRSLRAGVGSSITTHGVRMKLGHKNNYSSLVKLHDYQGETVHDSYALAITEEVN